jgi:hypothetical protein
LSKAHDRMRTLLLTLLSVLLAVITAWLMKVLRLK